MMKERLSWIPLSHRKNITLPKVVVEPDVGQPYGGYYLPGSNTLVAVQQDKENLSSTFAHEYRHHIQYELNLYQNMAVELKFNLSYENMIVDFFNRSPAEMDALLFEHKYAKSEINDWWLNHLLNQKAKNVKP